MSDQKPVNQRLPKISRRKFLGGVMVSGTSVGLARIATRARATVAVVAPEAHAAFKILTPNEGRVLTAMLDRLVPRSEQMPGAGELGIARYLDDLLVEAPHLRNPIRSVINRVRAPLPGSSSPISLDQRLERVEQRDPASFRALLQSAYTGYYSHPDVLARIAGPESHGGEQAFDMSMLENVVKRGPIWRDV